MKSHQDLREGASDVASASYDALDVDTPRAFRCNHCGFEVRLPISTLSITCPVCSVMDGAGYADHPADNDHLRRRPSLAASPRVTSACPSALALAARVASAQVPARWPEGGVSAEGAAVAAALSEALPRYAAALSGRPCGRSEP